MFSLRHVFFVKNREVYQGCYIAEQYGVSGYCQKISNCSRKVEFDAAKAIAVSDKILRYTVAEILKVTIM